MGMTADYDRRPDAAPDHPNKLNTFADLIVADTGAVKECVRMTVTSESVNPVPLNLQKPLVRGA
jgi:hypothetical protein